MKTNFIDEIKSIVEQSKTWLQLEMEYAKLTIAEKLTLLMTSMIFGFVCLLLGVVILIILSLSVSELFKLIMCPALAYLATAGAIVVLLVILYLVRKPVLITPIARMFTKIFFDKNSDGHE